MELDLSTKPPTDSINPDPEIRLRPYQIQCSNAVFETWATDYATLIALFVGGGKTVIFSDVVRRIHPQKVMLLVHRDELIWQAKAKIEQVAKLSVMVDLAGERLTPAQIDSANVIITTVQSQYSQTANGSSHMHRFNPMLFGAVIVDEAHRYLSPRWSDVIHYWRKNPDLRLLGVTATPRRHDGIAMKNVFPHCCFKMGIDHGVGQGWLVPPLVKCIKITGLDFDKVNVVKGDFVKDELAKIMEEESVLQGIASATLQEIENRKTIVFTVRVAQAEKLCEIFNRYKRGCAFFVCGTTRKEVRRNLLKRFKAGEFQIFCNVDIATEGWDDPEVSCIVNARPTLSAVKFEQMNGRGFRPWPGCVDDASLDTPEKRLASIEASPKKNVLILDLAGNSSKHRLCSISDVLGGSESPKVLDRAAKIIRTAEHRINAVVALEQAKEEITREEREGELAKKRAEEKRRERITAKATYVARYIDPFSKEQFGKYQSALSGKKGLTEKQWFFLKARGIDPAANPIWRNYQLLSEIHTTEAAGPPSAAQLKYARSLGIKPDGHTKKSMTKAIDQAKRQKTLI